MFTLGVTLILIGFCFLVFFMLNLALSGAGQSKARLTHTGEVLMLSGAVLSMVEITIGMTLALVHYGQ